MKAALLIVIFLLSLVSCKSGNQRVQNTLANSGTQIKDSTDMTNNFYDNTETYPLPVKIAT
jgi:hypothetical protein